MFAIFVAVFLGTAHASGPLVLPVPVGACGEVDAARIEAIGGAGAFTAENAVGELHAKLLAVGPVCRPAAGGTPSVEVVALPTLPAQAGSDASWAREHPLVVALLPGELRFGRWPLAGVIAERDRALARRLLRHDRQLYATRRIGMLVVPPGEPASEVDAWIGEMARAGYVAVGLVVDPSAWRPVGTSPFVERSTMGPIRVPEHVDVSTEGDFTARFPLSTGIRPVSVPAGDVRYFLEGCRDGTCDLVLVTDDERILVRRSTEAPADDLTRRWVFGSPVVSAGNGLVRHLAPPTSSGTITALPQVLWGQDPPPGKEADVVSDYIARRGNFLIRPCWMKHLNAWRAMPLFARDPFGRIVTRLHVSAEGKVQQVDVLTTDLKSKPVIRCVVRGMEAMRLPRGPDNVAYTLDVPYGFGKGD